MDEKFVSPPRQLILQVRLWEKVKSMSQVVEGIFDEIVICTGFGGRSFLKPDTATLNSLMKFLDIIKINY